MKFASAVLFLSLFAGAARAEPAAATPPEPSDSRKARMEKSLDCSRQADGRNLTGAPRKEFMRGCMKI